MVRTIRVLEGSFALIVPVLVLDPGRQIGVCHRAIGWSRRIDDRNARKLLRHLLPDLLLNPVARQPGSRVERLGIHVLIRRLGVVQPPGHGFRARENDWFLHHVVLEPVPSQLER